MSTVRIATTYMQRLRGLLFTKPSSDELLIPGCCDIHTYGMAYALDVAFLDAGMHVVATYRNVKPGRRIRCPGACMVVERAHDRSRDWYQKGTSAGQRIRHIVEERSTR